MGATDQLLLQIIGEDDNATASVNQTATAIDGLTASEQQAVKASTDVTEQNSKAGLSFTDLRSAIDLTKQTVGMFKEVFDFTQEGAQIQRINDQWSRTAQNMGVNSDQIVAQVQKVTNNTVDDEEIMKNATREIAQGVATSGQQVVDFFHIARAQTVLFGGDVVSNAQAIDLAIETGAAKQLKARGILVDFVKAENDYAKAIGTTKDKLTEEQIIEVRRNEVLRAGNDLVAKAGDTAKDTATKFEQLTVKIADMTDALKQQAAAGAGYLFDVLTPTDDKVQQFKNTIILETLAFGENSQQVKVVEAALTAYLRAQKEANDKIENGTDILQSRYIPATSQAAKAIDGFSSSQAAFAKQQEEVKKSMAEYDQSVKDIAKSNLDQALSYGSLAEKFVNVSTAQYVYSGTTKKTSLTTDELNVLTAKSAALSEDLKTATQKKNETQADFNLRLAETKSQYDKVNDSLNKNNEAMQGATATAHLAPVPIDLVKAALDGLKKELQAGTISQGQYTDLLQSTEIKYGLATKASFAMEQGINLLNTKFAEGVISADQYQSGLAKLPTAAADGVVTLNDLGIKTVSDHQSHLDRMLTLGDDAIKSSTSTALAQTKAQVDTANAQIDTITSHWDRVPRDVVTHYKIVADAFPSTPTPGAGIGGAQAGGGIVGAANGVVLAGEFGPERVSLPYGSQVHTTSQYNQYNDYNITTNDMGLAYLMESQRMAMQGQLDRRMA